MCGGPKGLNPGDFLRDVLWSLIFILVVGGVLASIFGGCKASARIEDVASPKLVDLTRKAEAGHDTHQDTNVGGGTDSISLWIATGGLALVALSAYPAQRRFRLWREQQNEKRAVPHSGSGHSTGLSLEHLERVSFTSSAPMPSPASKTGSGASSSKPSTNTGRGSGTMNSNPSTNS